MSRVTEQVDRAGEDAGAPPQPHTGMVVTSQPRAVAAAREVLDAGGNAVDAAVCAAAVLGVVEPMSTGIGGDCFALCWREDEQQLYGLNGSGRAPRAASLEALSRRGLRDMPQEGILSVTVPGALDGFDRLVHRLGTRELGTLIEPAARIARDGFEVTPVTARDWAEAADRLAQGHGTTQAFLPGGRAPRAGEQVRAPELAATLERVAREGVAAFYRGDIGRRIADEARRLDGWLSMGDLERHESTWVQPLETVYRGYPVYELPPNGQGIVVLEALRMLDEFPLGDLPPDERGHVMIEALKLAFADALAYVTDPDHVPVSMASLLRDDYIERRLEALGDTATRAPTPGQPEGDTVYVAVLDRDGNACSLIHSIYMPFGANVVVPATGVCLQNRGALFSTEPAHPNALAPDKRPYHTIIPAMAFAADAPWLVFGVVGGFQQPQAQLQLLIHLIDSQMTPQAALDAPRFRWLSDRRIGLEEGYSSAIADGLQARGHQITNLDGPGGFGGAQAIALDPETRAPRGATDPRKDGCAG